MANPKKRLTIKQQKLIQGIVAGKTQRQAARDAGYVGPSADVNASKILNKPHVMCETRRVMEEAGFTLPALLQDLDRLRHAKKPIAATIINRPGKTKGQRDANSRTTDFIEVDDNATQIKALDMAFTLRDDYPNKINKTELTGPGGRPLFQLDDDLKALIERAVNGEKSEA